MVLFEFDMCLFLEINRIFGTRSFEKDLPVKSAYIAYSNQYMVQIYLHFIKLSITETKESTNIKPKKINSIENANSICSF